MPAFHECGVVNKSSSVSKRKPLKPDLKLARMCSCHRLVGKLFHNTAPLWLKLFCFLLAR